MTATGLFCGSCGAESSPAAKFCSECGTPLTHATPSAEYKQVTVLFADVVRSMDIAAVVGAERLREIMTELVERSAVVVRRYGGMVNKFTGDGIMAVFGAPAALENHAFRACLAALDIQAEATKLAEEVEARDGVDLRLRVGLNSGQVIAGAIGSGTWGYNAVGEQVGMAQRMESVAPPGGVMLSASTARLVEGAAVLGEPERVHVKGADHPVCAQRLLGVSARRGRLRRWETSLVGRQWELGTLSGALEQAVAGQGCVVGITGPAGIGKSRLVDEAVSIATCRGIDVFATFCESHTSDIAFHVVTALMRAASGVTDLDDEVARAKVRAQIPDADPQDLLLLDDLLGIADPTVPLPLLDADTRRHRLGALINAAMAARTTPAVCVVEDVHWIDKVSESMLADYLAVIPHIHALVLITYRPEYQGVLARSPGSHTVFLAPLNASQTAALTAEMLGSHPSVAGLAARVAERAAGNPFFVQELVRELAERGVLDGEVGGYVCRSSIGDVSVPATLQATLAARIDRLEPGAKRALGAASVIGSRFDPDLLSALRVDPLLDELVNAELIDQVRFTPRPEYAFRHPLIRTVSYESQLKADRADFHRRVATAIEARGSPDEDAALIAEHLEAAGDMQAAYSWHMRAGKWLRRRYHDAARTSWQRAEQIARAAVERGGGLQAAELLARALLWQGNAAEAEEVLSPFDPDELTEAELVRWGLTRIANLHWAMGDAERADEVLAMLRAKVSDPTLRLLVDGVASASLLFENQLAQAIVLSQQVLADASAPAAAVQWAVFGGGLALALMGRGDEVSAVAERGHAVRSRVEMLWYLTAYGEVNALVLAGKFDAAAKRSAGLAQISSADPYTAWGMANVLVGTVKVAQGRFADTVARMEQTVAALTSESAASWSFPARLLLARSYCALGRVGPGAKMVAELRTRFGRHVAVFGPQLRIAEAWLAAAEGNVSAAIDLALDAAGRAEESGQRAIAMLALHDAVRFGDQSGLSRLIDLATGVGGRLAAAIAGHAAAVRDRDAAAIFAAAHQFEQIGALLSAADAAAQAASAFEARGDRRRTVDAAALAHRLAAECGGATTPAITSSAQPVQVISS